MIKYGGFSSLRHTLTDALTLTGAREGNAHRIWYNCFACNVWNSLMEITANIPVGSVGTKPITVAREMTVAHFHENMPEVYGTPMMIYLMEVTATETIQPYLPEGWTTVGTVVNVSHL